MCCSLLDLADVAELSQSRISSCLTTNPNLQCRDKFQVAVPRAHLHVGWGLREICADRLPLWLYGSDFGPCLWYPLPCEQYCRCMLLIVLEIKSGRALAQQKSKSYLERDRAREDMFVDHVL